MKIGVVADTNDNRASLQQLLDRFLVGGAQRLLHCGGLGSAGLIELPYGTNRGIPELKNKRNTARRG